MVVRLHGGLGNQAFEYAFGRSVSLVRDEPLYFEKFELDDAHRNYGLDAFSLDTKFTTKTGPKYEERIFSYDKAVYSVPNGMHFVGCWQTEKYFCEEIIRDEMRLKNPVSRRSAALADEIMSCDSACIHVRRGDYLDPVTAAYHGVIGMDYYTAAMACMQARVPGVKFFVFSDDPEWCRRHFPACRLMDIGPPHEDMWLMSLCEHAIIGNSTFGWWGAWLGDRKNRVCIAPKRWFLGARLDYSDIVPERWIKM